jgi:hypothetical protein
MWFGAVGVRRAGDLGFLKTIVGQWETFGRLFDAGTGRLASQERFMAQVLFPLGVDETFQRLGRRGVAARVAAHGRRVLQLPAAHQRRQRLRDPAGGRPARARARRRLGRLGRLVPLPPLGGDDQLPGVARPACGRAARGVRQRLARGRVRRACRRDRGGCCGAPPTRASPRMRTSPAGASSTRARGSHDQLSAIFTGVADAAQTAAVFGWLDGADHDFWGGVPFRRANLSIPGGSGGRFVRPARRGRHARSLRAQQQRRGQGQPARLRTGPPCAAAGVRELQQERRRGRRPRRRLS